MNGRLWKILEKTGRIAHTEDFMETIFTKIINGEIPSTQLYTDDRCIVILDIAPVHKGHALVISREPYPTTETCPDDLLGHMMKIARKLDISMRKKIGAEATNTRLPSKYYESSGVL